MILRTVFKRERETDKTSIQPGSQPDSADQFAECERVGSPPPQTVLSRRDSSQSAFKKKTCSQSLPLYQPALSLLLSSCPFISNIFLPFGVCICDRSGHSGVCMCFSLFRRGRMIKKCVSKTSVTRRGNVCGCVLKLKLLSADRWLTEMTSSIRHFRESP